MHGRTNEEQASYEERLHDLLVLDKIEQGEAALAQARQEQTELEKITAHAERLGGIVTRTSAGLHIELDCGQR